MEMKNPIFLIVGLIILVIVFFIGRKQRIKYKTGKRIANTRYKNCYISKDDSWTKKEFGREIK